MDRWQRVPWHRSPLVLRLTFLPSRFSKILPAPGSTYARINCLRQGSSLVSKHRCHPSFLLLLLLSGSRNYPTRFVFALGASHPVFFLPSPTIVITVPRYSSRSLDQYVYVISLHGNQRYDTDISQRTTSTGQRSSVTRVTRERNVVSPTTRLFLSSIRYSLLPRSSLQFVLILIRENVSHSKCFRRLEKGLGTGLTTFATTRVTRWRLRLVRRFASQRLNLTPEKVSVRCCPRVLHQLDILRGHIGRKAHADVLLGRGDITRGRCCLDRIG